MIVSCLNERLSSAASIALALWFASQSGLAAVIGNAVVRWLFYKSVSLRTISNGFLESFFVADFLVRRACYIPRLVIDPVWIDH